MGRDKRNEQRSEHYTKMLRTTMQEPAWRALSPCAQALYPWLKLEWNGPNANNNGKLRLSVRQAAQCLGVNVKTAARAFHDLQAKGFITVTEPACLGAGGSAQSPMFEVTELATPSGGNAGRKLYKKWQSGADFPVSQTRTNNPRGFNGNHASKGEINVIKLHK